MVFEYNNKSNFNSSSRYYLSKHFLCFIMNCGLKCVSCFNLLVFLRSKYYFNLFINKIVEFNEEKHRRWGQVHQDRIWTLPDVSCVMLLNKQSCNTCALIISLRLSFPLCKTAGFQCQLAEMRADQVSDAHRAHG